MTRIRIEDSGAEAEARRLLRRAVESKVARIRLAIGATEARVQTFERRYGVSSSDFAARLTSRNSKPSSMLIGDYFAMDRL